VCPYWLPCALVVLRVIRRGEAWCLGWQIEFRAIYLLPAGTTVLLACEEASPASAFMSHFGGVPDSEDEVERAPVRVPRARTRLTGWCPIMTLRIGSPLALGATDLRQTRLEAGHGGGAPGDLPPELRGVEVAAVPRSSR